MTTTHSNFLATILRGAGVSEHVPASNHDWACSHFPKIFENIGVNEVVIASGSVTLEVKSMSDVNDNWEDLHSHSSKKVHLYLMSNALWAGIEISLRHQEEEVEKLTAAG